MSAGLTACRSVCSSGSLNGPTQESDVSQGRTRRRILDAADGLISRRGLSAADASGVARAAHVRARTVRRLVGDRAGLLRAVLARRDQSQATAVIADGARTPSGVPPLSSLMAAGHLLFLEPRRSWDSVELEALVLADTDPAAAEVARERLDQRATHLRHLVEASRAAGGVDPTLSDASIVHLSLALSVGLAMVDPVLAEKPSVTDWDALIARIGSSVAPDDMQLDPAIEASRRWRARVDIADRPGGIAAAVRALAAVHVYTVYLQVVASDGAHRTIDLGLIAPATVSRDVILGAVSAVGSQAHLTTGGPDDGTDLLTKTLDGATHLVKHPQDAPQLAAALLAADDVEVIDAAAGVADRADVLRLQWTTTQHVLLHRRWAPFARTEQARASAVLRLSAAVARVTGRHTAGVGWIDATKAGTVWIRLARPEDADLVAALHERTSEGSRYQRYFAHTQWRDLQLRRLTGGHRGGTLVAMSRGGDIVALGNVFPQPDEERTAEIALLVEDAQQGQGLGRVMLRRLLELAADMGFVQVTADVLSGNGAMLHLLEQAGLSWSTSVAEGVRTLRAPLPVDDGAALD